MNQNRKKAIEELEQAVMELNRPYVVEDTRTGSKYVTDYWSALAATFDGGGLWTSQKLSHIIIYPLKGAAVDILYGNQKKD